MVTLATHIRILISVVFIQWALITYIMVNRLHEEVDRETENIHRVHAVPVFKSDGTDTVKSTSNNVAYKGDIPPLLNSSMTFDGVAGKCKDIIYFSDIYSAHCCINILIS